jgi:hypothetical protein
LKLDLLLRESVLLGWDPLDESDAEWIVRMRHRAKAGVELLPSLRHVQFWSAASVNLEKLEGTMSVIPREYAQLGIRHTQSVLLWPNAWRCPQQSAGLTHMSQDPTNGA